MLLAPGEYRFSVAIWDKNEVLPYDYHNGCYRLTIKGINRTGELLNMAFMLNKTGLLKKLSYFNRINKRNPDLRLLVNRWGQKTETAGLSIESIKLLDNFGQEKSSFLTNEPAELNINLRDIKIKEKDVYLWAGIYRDDGVYCQGVTIPLGKDSEIRIFFPRLKLLPGTYRISAGVWGDLSDTFLTLHHGIYNFKMLWDRQDHGTIYMNHKWNMGGVK